MKLWVYKLQTKLVPATSGDKDKFAKMPNAEPFMVSYVKVRNPLHHRKYFAFINKVYDNLPECYDEYWPDDRSFRKAMEMYAGYFTETITLKGDRQLQPKSIKYEDLDETAFIDLHKSVKNFIGKHILPKMDMDIVEKEIEPFY